MYKIAQVCFLNGLPDQQLPSDEVVSDLYNLHSYYFKQYELNLPDPEPHTEQTMSIKPPKKKLTSAEIDVCISSSGNSDNQDILKKSASATPESIFEANLTQAKIVRQW